jgi:hypothetical protein
MILCLQHNRQFINKVVLTTWLGYVLFTTVKFSSWVKTANFDPSQCGTKTYSWSGCTSSSDTCSKTYGSTETGSKAVTVTVKQPFSP